MSDNAIRAAHERELEELDDALVSDDNWHRDQTGEVLWLDRQCNALWRKP